MFKSSAKTIATVSGDSKTVDVVVVLAAGLFFANIVMGSQTTQEPILAYAAELQVQDCAGGCLAFD